MKRLAAILCLMLIGAACHAQRILREVSWTDHADKSTSGRVLPPGRDARFAQLRIDGRQFVKTTAHVFTFGKPGIEEQTYAVTGLVRYEDVEGEAYLEMWSTFPGRQQYFTKTLDSGTLAPLKGSSGWRRFTLPFDMTGSKFKPERLVVNVVLPGKGTVYLSPLSLVEPARYADMVGLPGQWWNPLWAARWAGLIGGGFGGLFGVLGALAGWLAPRGRGRRFILGAWTVMVLAGAVALAAGIVALAIRQPYWVAYPLLLTGLIVTVVGGALLLVVRSRYYQAELRKMKAQDAIR